MLYLEPSLRRKYLNLILSQTDKFYLEALGNYTKLLKQRNALLEEIAEEKTREDELDIWDERLAGEGAVLIAERKKLIKFFNGKIGGFYRKISGGKEDLEIKYASTVLEEKDENLDDIHAIKKKYLKKLVLKRDRDLRYGSTSSGPHVEDIKFYLNDKEISSFASRGEFRTILIALKMAEIDYIENKTKEKPVLLLDDVFSELDENRQAHLFDAIKSCQAIITAAGVAIPHLSDKISKVVEL